MEKEEKQHDKRRYNGKGQRDIPGCIWWWDSRYYRFHEFGWYRGLGFARAHIPDNLHGEGVRSEIRYKGSKQARKRRPDGGYDQTKTGWKINNNNT